MKRFIILLAVIASTVIVYAKPPRLAVEELFDGRYNKEKSVSTSIYKNNGYYYRGMTIKNNPKIIKKIVGAIDKDASRAANYSDNKDENGQYTFIQITNNGETINVGLQRDNTGVAYFFIQGKEKAFK